MNQGIPMSNYSRFQTTKDNLFYLRTVYVLFLAGGRLLHGGVGGVRPQEEAHRCQGKVVLLPSDSVTDSN